jgi:hypothetical protein
MSQTSTQATTTLAGDVVTLPQQRSASDLDSALAPQTVSGPEGLSAGTEIPAQRTASPAASIDEPGQLTAPGVVTELAGPESGQPGTQHRVRGLFTRLTHSPSAEKVELGAQRVTRSRHDRVVGVQSDHQLTNALFIRGLR